MTKEGMAVGRSISEGERSLYSYESCLNLKSGALRHFLEEEATRKGAPLSLLEFGVGLGHAFRDFCSWSVIDGDQSRGLTLPFLHCDEGALKTRSFDSISQEDVHWESKDPKITVGSCLHLRTTRSFDCVLSVWALSEYHPLGPIFGALQGIAAVKEGGLLITDLGPRKGELLDLFIEREILLQIPELIEKAHFSQISVGIQRLIKRPTMEEIIERLRGSRLDEYLQ